MDSRFLKKRLERAERVWVEAKRTGDGYYEAKQELRAARAAWRKVRPPGTVQPDTIKSKTKVS